MELNRLGMILNLSPYVIFFVFMFVGMIVEAFFVVGRERALLVKRSVARVGPYR